MPLINVKNLDNSLKEIQSQGKKPEKILIGYKAYGELMNDRKFSDEVTGSAMDPNKRKYKNIKIKVTQDSYQLEIKSSSKSDTHL
ncbi:hypothetical protein QR674_07775 [Acinetobacter chinensis]|uniref:Uncharacterized protein n=1 Tax=Acinetobacter chinensis TaxID=2004650 RepID=A0ABU3WE15_9GAMM|nr:hypothetical protein [Acinetobacter chinensis]MDV2468308.1 hypothetical protein [Acinetobacter chinensis]MDV2468881.1 hypothetical protein [Acinetobacter chinensis]WOE43065.1 hypothetical protein QSG87_08100 [Acinetobacter chinensis]